MTKNEILSLNSKKNIKIWLLHKAGCSNKEIAVELKTNQGHVRNEIKSFNSHKQKQDNAIKFSRGGVLVGNKHGAGGIEIKTPEGKIEAESGEIIINAVAAKEHCKELSKINQSAGNGVAFPCNNPALDGIQGPMAGEGAKIEAEHEDLYNELASLIPGGMPLSKEAFFEKIAKTHIKEDPDYYKKLEKYVEPKAGNGYEVVWTDRDYKRHSKKFFNDPQGAPENDLLAAKRYAKMLNEKDANSPYGLYRSVDVKRMVSNDASKKPYYLLTKEETIAERDRLEANNTNPQRLQDLCRYSYTKFKTLLKDLK